MTTEIAKREASMALSMLTDEQKQLIAKNIAPKATEDELALFFAVCNRTGLDPFAKQIYLVERWDANAGANVHRAQVSIDGARLIAARTGRYSPGTSYFYAKGDDKEWKIWLNEQEPPAAARVTVFVDGKEAPGYPVNFSEVSQTNKDGGLRSNWKKMPVTMLRKCAEMATLRQAFPQELSGLYLEDESGTPVTIETVVEEELATDEQLADIADGLAKILSNDVSQDALDARLLANYETTELKKLTRTQADQLLERLEEE